MRYSLLIGSNDFDLGNYIPAGGVKVSKVFRNEKTVTTMSGLKYMRRKEKNKISVNLFDMPDKYYKEVIDAITESNPITIAYADLSTGFSDVGQYYVTLNGYGVRKTLGNITYLNDISLELEEK